MDGNVGMDHLDNPIDWFDENDPLIATGKVIGDILNSNKSLLPGYKS